MKNSLSSNAPSPLKVPHIRIKNLYKIFGENATDAIAQLQSGKSKEQLMQESNLSVGLNNINLDINQGETFVVMGLSGSGKSTLIRHFNRLIEPTAGVIELDGKDICSLSSKGIQALRRHKMSMVFQRFGLLPHRTVIQNVAYGLRIQKLSQEECYHKASHWIDIVGLKGYEKQYPNQLSGGQQQRVGLARALCTDADILLMDEAFSALDPLIRSEMQLQLKDLQQKLNKTIIFITHDLDEALRLGDRIAILKDGELVQQGSPIDILLNPTTDYVASFVKDINRARALTVRTVMEPLDEWDGDIEIHRAVTCDHTLESVMSRVLESKCPIAVMDSTGKLIGKVQASKLAQVLQ